MKNIRGEVWTEPTFKKPKERITESKAETVTVSDDKSVFKAYLANAIDASKRLLEFINSHGNEPLFKDKTRELFNSILGQIEDKI